MLKEIRFAKHWAAKPNGDSGRPHTKPGSQAGVTSLHATIGDAGRGVRGSRPVVLCGSTVLEARSRYVCMVFALRFSVVGGVSPTTCGSAPFTRCNPRLHRRTDTAFAFVESRTV
jgi:hypothetical protein